LGANNIFFLLSKYLYRFYLSNKAAVFEPIFLKLLLFFTKNVKIIFHKLFYFMQFSLLKKFSSFVLIVSLSFVSLSHGFMKMEVKQIIAPDGSLQNINLMDMSGMFAQFEALGISIKDLPPEQKQQIEASFDGVCDQALAQIKTSITPENISPEQLATAKAMQASFECKKVSFGKFEIKMNTQMNADQYSIEGNQFILASNNIAMTPEIREQIDMMMNQKMKDQEVSPEQITQIKALGMEVTMVFVLPGKIIESNIGDIDGDTVTIDLFGEMITMVEAGNSKEFIEKLMNMRIVAEMDTYVANDVVINNNDSVSATPTSTVATADQSLATTRTTDNQGVLLPTNTVAATNLTTSETFLPEDTLPTPAIPASDVFVKPAFLADLVPIDTNRATLDSVETPAALRAYLPQTETVTPTEADLLREEEALWLELLEADLSNEDITALLAAEIPALDTLTPPQTEPLITPIIEPTAPTTMTSPLKVLIPASTKTLDKETIEAEVIHNIFAQNVFEDLIAAETDTPTPAPKKTKQRAYSPDRIFQNIKAANLVRQAAR
jgi:hypothetical protein